MIKTAGLIAIVSFSLLGCNRVDYLPDVATSVKVVLGETHGSGVHIGGGIFLTAEHVVTTSTNATLKTSDGNSHKGVVLWTSKEYDVAAVYVNGYKGRASRLSCSVARVGDKVAAVGNPIKDEFLTTWGRISALPVKNNKWESAYRVQIPIAPGSSGGPVFNMRGQVVGIGVGGGLFQVGLGGSAYGIAFVVPSSEICKLIEKQS